MEKQIEKRKSDIFSLKPQDIVPGLFILLIYFLFTYILWEKNFKVESVDYYKQTKSTRMMK